MGMDLLDIIFRIEKTFGIDMSKEDTLGLIRDEDITVGDLYELLLKKLQLRDVGRFDLRLNEELWLRMQGVLHSVTGVPLDEIKLKGELEALFPRPLRRTMWDAFRDACPYRVRDLDYPQTVRVIGLLLAVGMLVVEQFQVWQIPGVKWFWPLLGALGIWMCGETYLKILRVCAPLRTCFPTRMRTVKELCRTVLATNYMEICSAAKVVLDERSLDVWRKLVEQIAAAIDVQPDEITFRSRLFRDLGAA